MKDSRRLSLTIVAAVTALASVTATQVVAQSPTARVRPQFDAAAIKPVKLADHPVFGNRGGPGTADPGRVHLCCVGMFSLLMRAFDVELDQIHGPAWIMENMGPNLYQLDATMPADTTQAQYQLMMEGLLEERFHLQFHRDQHNFPGYELVVAEDGARLKASTPASELSDSDSPPTLKRANDGTLILPPGPQMFTSLGMGEILVQFQQKPLSDFVKSMGRLIAQSLGENPNDFETPKPRVIDRTGLTGIYDFTLRFSCDSCEFAATNGGVAPIPPPGDSGRPETSPNIFAAFQKQLGLKLVKVKEIPLDVIVVDRVDKTPTDN